MVSGKVQCLRGMQNTRRVALIFQAHHVVEITGQLYGLYGENGRKREHISLPSK